MKLARLLATAALALLAVPSLAFGQVREVDINDGNPSHGTLSIVPSVYGLAASPGILNSTPGQPLVFAKSSNRTALDGVDFDVRRVADYTTGGTAGYVNAGLRVLSTVTADRPSYEWAFLSVMDNSSAGAQGNENVAAYFQGRKRSTGSTWAMTDELIDYLPNPTTSSVTAEHDLVATGTDNNNVRVIADYFSDTRDGNPAEVAYGIRLTTKPSTTIKHGLTLAGTYSGSAINIPSSAKLCLDGTACANYISQASNVLHLWANGTDLLDVTAFGVTGAAFNATAGNIGLPSGNKLCLDGNSTCAHWLWYTSGATWIGNSTNGSVYQFNDAGGLTVGALNAQGGPVYLNTNGKACFNGTSCTIYATYDGTSMVFSNGGSAKFTTNMSSGIVAAAGGFSAGLANGVSCAAGTVTLATLTVVGGIVTHC